MKKRVCLCVGAVVCLALGVLTVAVLTGAAEPAGGGAPAPAQPKIAPNRIVTVTVYQNSARVTREVDVPEGTGTIELVVSQLPAQTVNTSLYSEGSDGLRVLTTRFRVRPMQEDAREEVRKIEAEIRK